jgi:hypothetical protein
VPQARHGLCRLQEFRISGKIFVTDGRDAGLRLIANYAPWPFLLTRAAHA